MEKTYNLKEKTFAFILLLFICSGSMLSQPGYYKGDFHQHSTYTDGSYSFPHMMKKNTEFGLDWWANSEHGGGFTRNAELSGTDLNTIVYWDQMVPNPIIGTSVISGGHQVMWRWQMLMGFSFMNLLDARALYPSKTIIQGYEMNVPGHEHGSVGLISGQFRILPNVYDLAQFEYKFDESDADQLGGASMGWKKCTLTGHEKTLEAIKWLQKYFGTESWIIPAHPERKKLYNISNFRDMNNAGPDVCFGFESMPGHQKDANRGGYSTSADGGGTYGGCGVYAAKIGGLWDAMLSEGRNFWLFANSDFHDEANDFYPGEYQKNYTFIENRYNAKSIVEGLRSGNNWVVEGDLINKLEFTATGIDKATMGETLKFNDKIKISIILKDPSSNNYNNQNPTLDHIDLIMGQLSGLVDPSDPNYNVPKAPNTRVIARFDKNGGTTDKNGITSIKWKQGKGGLITINYVVSASESCYLRLRGTNNGLNVPGETDSIGNPMLDFTTGANSAEKAWNDLWFYSNPIFAITSNLSANLMNTKSQENNKEISLSQNKNEQLNIFPNPVQDVINFGNIDENTSVEIFNNSGSLVKVVNVDKNSINISDLATGTYIIKVLINNKYSTARFIKE